MFNEKSVREAVRLTDSIPAPKAEPVVKCGVGVVIRYDGMVLVGRRKGAHGEGILAFPGGHIDPTDASFAKCCKREVDEELGMEVDILQVDGRDDIFTTFDILSEDGSKRYVTSYFLADYVAGGVFNRKKVKPLEPDKVQGNWFWVTLDELGNLVEKDDRPQQRQWIPIALLMRYRETLGL